MGVIMCFALLVTTEREEHRLLGKAAESKEGVPSRLVPHCLPVYTVKRTLFLSKAVTVRKVGVVQIHSTLFASVHSEEYTVLEQNSGQKGGAVEVDPTLFASVTKWRVQSPQQGSEA